MQTKLLPSQAQVDRFTEVVRSAFPHLAWFVHASNDSPRAVLTGLSRSAPVIVDIFHDFSDETTFCTVGFGSDGMRLTIHRTSRTSPGEPIGTAIESLRSYLKELANSIQLATLSEA